MVIEPSASKKPEMYWMFIVSKVTQKYTRLPKTREMRLSPPPLKPRKNLF
jgi:hypothetical protein